MLTAGDRGLAIVLLHSEKTVAPILRAAGRDDLAREIVAANDLIIAEEDFTEAVQLARTLGFRRTDAPE